MVPKLIFYPRLKYRKKKKKKLKKPMVTINV